MPPDYLFEFHRKDGRTDRRPGSDYDHSAAFEVGQRVVIEDKGWIVRARSDAYGYDAKIVLEEE